MENTIRLSIEGMPAHEALGAVALSLWRNHLAHCMSHASGAVQKRRNITHAVVSGRGWLQKSLMNSKESIDEKRI